MAIATGLRVATKSSGRIGTVCAISEQRTGKPGRPKRTISVEFDDGNVADYTSKDLRLLTV